MLNGMPGAPALVRRSATTRNLRLLPINDVPDERRGAHSSAPQRWVCCRRARGRSAKVRSRPLIRERGSNGFGYDPIFVPEGDDPATAEMTPAEKDAISHRGRALRGLVPVIAALVG
jgi:XTP/dITP diphosphohydrolase